MKKKIVWFYQFINNMLTEKDFCDYDTCVALEELGYPRYHYDNGGELDKILRMVTLYNAQKWLREEKGIYIEIQTSFMDNGVGKFSFRLQTREFYDRAIGEWDTYEDALSEGIKEVVKVLKEK